MPFLADLGAQMQTNHPKDYSGIAAFVLCIMLLMAGVWLAGQQVRLSFFPPHTSVKLSPQDLAQSQNQFGDVQEDISKTFTSEYSNTTGIESDLRSTAKEYLAEGKYQSALAAAKAYYNIAELRKTKDAVNLVATVAAKVRGPETAEAFRKAQLADNAISPSTDVANVNDLLRSIPLESSQYEQAIQVLSDKCETAGAQIACGNSLLLADRPTDARMCFELALQLIVKNIGRTEELSEEREAAHALDGIARAIRDEDSSAFRADGFALTMRARSIAQATDQGAVTLAMSDPIRNAASQMSTSGIFDRDPVFNSLRSDEKSYAEASFGPDVDTSQSAQLAGATIARGSNLVSFASPEDPWVKAAGDPALSSWLREWQRTKYGGDSLEDRRAELKQILAKSPLSSLALVGIGRAISFQTADEWTEGALYAAAIPQAQRELARYSVGANETRPILDALYSVKSKLWKLVDGGDRTFTGVLYSLNCDLIHWIPEEDSNLRDARFHGFVGRAECLWAMGKYEDAMIAANSIDTTSASPQEKLGVAWIRGLALFSNGRYAPAISQFQAVAADPTYQYSDQACPFLVICLARSGRNDEANSRLDDWIKRCHPNLDQVKNVLARIGPAPVGLSG
jgi:tetratricopeptide (TPR) repeat protein